MPGTDFSSIPLPSENKQARLSHKMSAKEILEKALKEHKSSKKETSKNNGSLVTVTDPVRPESSQRIVDELFKDFIISKKINQTVTVNKNSVDHVEGGISPSGKGLSSISEMSKLLDLEISSIQAHTKDVPVQVSISHNTADEKGKEFSAKKISPDNENADSISSQTVKNTKKNIDTGNCSSHDTTSTNSSSTSMIPFPSKTVNQLEGTHDIKQSQEHPQFRSVEAREVSLEQINKDQSSVLSTDHPSTLVLSHSNSLTKKTGGPKQLGFKLSMQTLALIQSTDKIDRKGRLWEEGEVASSHSGLSDKDEERSVIDKDDLSETGSIASRVGDSKHRSSKHKKKHKHKHKKKKKKSNKEKDRDSKSRSLDPEKESDGEKSKGNDNDDTTEVGSSLSHNKVHSHRHSDKEELKDKKILGDSLSEKERERSLAHLDVKQSSKERDEGKRGEKTKKRKRDRSRSRSPKHRRRSKSRSRSRSPSKKSRRDSSPTKRSSTRVQFGEWDARHYSDNPSKTDRDGSLSPESKEKSLIGKRSRSGDDDRDLRLRIDKTKLRKIAIANALSNLKSGQGQQLDVVTVKAGGKSVEELTDFCKRISEKDRDNNHEVSDSSDEEPAPKSDDDELPIHHPFKVKDTSSNIIMNIRNSKQLPILTPTEKQAKQATLRLSFPVSSGSHHRATESEWVPVERPKAAPSSSYSSSSYSKAIMAAPSPPIHQKTEEPKEVFPEQKVAQNLDIGSIISERIQAVRKLQENPYDVQALSTIHKAQEKANEWATSKHLPGQFMGSTGAKVLSQQEIIGDKHHQAWAKKSQFTNAAPIRGGIGLFLLQKMGWKLGEGLGKNNEGNREPLQLDFKIDRKGLSTAMEKPKGHKPQIINVPRAKDLSSKHPVSALMELCNRRRWGAPAFTIVLEDGPDHKKNFLFKVKVNNVEYQPSVPYSNKKSAKAQCAAVCLQEMGLIPRDQPLNY